MRSLIITLYKRYETPVNYVLKFIMGFFIFASINGYFSSLGTPYATKIAKFSIVLLSAVLTSIAPPTWVFVLMWIFITFHIFFFSLELSVFAGLLLLCLILFYIRLFPRESYLIVLLLLCFKLKIPYFVPLFAGLFTGVGSSGALIAGAFIWHSLSYIKMFADAGSTLQGVEVLVLPETFADNYKLLIEIMANDGSWIYIASTFVITAIIMHIISKLSVNYSMEIALVTGALLLMMSFIAGILTSTVSFSVLGSISSITVSAILVYICKLFYIILDYTGTERVSFQDDDYMYYVKAVPKIRTGAEGD